MSYEVHNAVHIKLHVLWRLVTLDHSALGRLLSIGSVGLQICGDLIMQLSFGRRPEKPRYQRYFEVLLRFWVTKLLTLPQITQILRPGCIISA